ncbi:MAG: hypothetical protein Q4P23_10900 [Micrococcaceae bacterium]|nr:hypothetical protein [Micrococcaceae bacterium]
MDTSHAGPAVPSTGPVRVNKAPVALGKLTWAAFAVALIALVSSWVAPVIVGTVARDAIVRHDMESFYLTVLVAWGLVIVLNLLALLLGIICARRPTGKVLSGAVIAIGATGILGLLFHLIQTGQITYLFR